MEDKGDGGWVLGKGSIKQNRHGDEWQIDGGGSVRGCVRLCASARRAEMWLRGLSHSAASHSVARCGSKRNST